MTKLLVLTGATAVGKTGLAIDWAARFNGEIIGADSRQIYRYMDIGTAKPSPDELAQIPHHLIDIVEPDQAYTLAQFQADATLAIEDITERGKLPMLVGGTGMYITAVLEGWQIPEIPPNEPLRAELEAMSNEALFEKLKVLDPVTAERIDRHNPRRLVRAVEVCLLSDRPFSELRQKNPPDYDVQKFVLDMPREDLYARADTRVDHMLAAGWVEESEKLLAMGYAPPMPSMSALGYPQIFAMLRGELSQAETAEKIKYATHHFIRRQYTWMRGHDGDSFTWITPEESATAQIENWLSNG